MAGPTAFAAIGPTAIPGSSTWDDILAVPTPSPGAVVGGANEPNASAGPKPSKKPGRTANPTLAPTLGPTTGATPVPTARPTVVADREADAASDAGPDDRPDRQTHGGADRAADGQPGAVPALPVGQRLESPDRRPAGATRIPRR